MNEQPRRADSAAILWGFAALVLTGCTPAGWNSTPPETTPAGTITVQPVSQVVPPGQTATFTVTATPTGSGSLNYRWTENGVDIPGATGASYTTAPAVPSANGSNLVGTFQVGITNGDDFPVLSQTVTLEVGPREPKQGDLRYLLLQQVPASDLGEEIGVEFCCGESVGNALGSGISMGSSGAWSASDQYLNTPSGFSMNYTTGGYPTFASDLQSDAAPNIVLTSLDLEPNSVYAVSWVQTTQPGGFDYRLDPVVSPGTGQTSQMQAQAVLDGTQSRIVTAVSFDASGSVNLISYGWQGDTTTEYEAQTVLIPPGSGVVPAVQTAATTLASEGYFISAFGGDDTYGYVLVGMRVQGDSYPRPIKVETGLGGTVAATDPTSANFTLVAWLVQYGNDLFLFEQ